MLLKFKLGNYSYQYIIQFSWLESMEHFWNSLELTPSYIHKLIAVRGEENSNCFHVVDYQMAIKFSIIDYFSGETPAFKGLYTVAVGDMTKFPATQ